MEIPAEILACTAPTERELKAINLRDNQKLAWKDVGAALGVKGQRAKQLYSIGKHKYTRRLLKVRVKRDGYSWRITKTESGYSVTYIHVETGILLLVDTKTKPDCNHSLYLPLNPASGEFELSGNWSEEFSNFRWADKEVKTAPSRKWTNIKDRLPTEADEDDFGEVYWVGTSFVRRESVAEILSWQSVKDGTAIGHWTRTGVRRPAPPGPATVTKLA